MGRLCTMIYSLRYGVWEGNGARVCDVCVLRVIGVMSMCDVCLCAGAWDIEAPFVDASPPIGFIF